MEQRIEDFEQLCDTLENGFPQLKMYDSKYEWNYKSRKSTTNFSFADESGENDNSIVGTVPDIYSAITVENMIKVSQII